MKKLLFFIFTGFIIFISLPMIGQSLQKTDDSDYEVIPDEAIRLRILANSDSDKDQALKEDVRDAVNAEINGWVEELNDIDQAREIIQSNVPELEKTVESVLEEAGSDQPYTLEYAEDVTFPTKLYGSYIYPAGEYEAVLITLGDGEGENWWCVLFPPLCFLDFSNGISVQEADEDSEQEAMSTEQEEVEVKFFLFEWLGLS